jgi:hypothetical protein
VQRRIRELTMQMNLRLFVLALAASYTVSAAQAAADLPGASSSGNSSVLFVAIDVNSNTGLVVDLGLNMADFTNGSSLPLVGTPVTWNFATNTTSLASITGNQWSGAYNTFMTAQSGNDFRWGVVAGDSVLPTSTITTDTIAGRGLLATGNPTVPEMLAASTSSPTGNALGNLTNFMAAANNLGTMRSANNGAAATDSGANSGTGGAAWLPTLMMNPLGTQGRFNGNLTWDYLLPDGATSTLQWQQQLVGNPVVNQLGTPGATDALASAPDLFTFDSQTHTLTWLSHVPLTVPPVPEPSTYAMLLAGLATVGGAVRRRKALLANASTSSPRGAGEQIL